MNPIIALLTDFGTLDYFVGAMKGTILSINRNANVVDITHEVPAQDISSASFTLRACYKNFPHKTIFAAVVDPGVGSNRKAILVETANYYFTAPDNGLLSFVFDEGRSPRVSKGGVERSALAHARASVSHEQLSPAFRVYELTNEKFFAENISRTFHGRDIFAPVAAHLSNGASPNEFGAEIKDFVHLETAAPRKISANEIEAEIIHADGFGNLITNLKAEDLPENFTLEIGGKTIGKLQTYFAEADKGELFMIAGSAGFLEICAFKDSAKDLLNVEIGERLLLTTN